MLKNTPFIFLTAKTDRSDFRRGMEQGADDYITKPFDGTELLSAIDSRFRKIDLLKEELSPGLEGLQHLLLAWELLGESRMATCVAACQRYLDFYLEHMQLEETVILPEAERLLSDDDWRVLDAAFKENTDPLGGKYPPNPAYDRLFTRIVLKARIPAGLGDSTSAT